MPPRTKASLNDKIKAEGATTRTKTDKPLWAGPNGDGPNGGITQGLMGRYLVCRERFRIWAFRGLRPREKFNPRMEFGNMWHACEEAHAKNESFEHALLKETDRLATRYPMDRKVIAHWNGVCGALFPRYVAYWSLHPDVTARKPLLQEAKFDVPYELPSGRKVRLRGKWDAVDLIDIGGPGIWIQENKTKSGIDVPSLSRQLTFDLQSMFYLVALKEWRGQQHVHTDDWFHEVMGVRYNVIKRPAHKSVEAMLAKLDEDTEDNRAGEWFARWNVNVHAADVERFKVECLNPVLENMCDDWEWLSSCHALGRSPFGPGRASAFRHPTRHFRFPYGVYNPLTESGPHDLNGALDSDVGYNRTSVLFPELT